MDILLQKVTQSAVQYAIRSGITITTGYALKECGRLLQQAPKSREREELQQLQFRLESKIRVISPSIDMIELIAARGNTSLESAVSLCKHIRYEIQKLGQRLHKAATDEEPDQLPGLLLRQNLASENPPIQENEGAKEVANSLSINPNNAQSFDTLCMFQKARVRKGTAGVSFSIARPGMFPKIFRQNRSRL